MGIVKRILKGYGIVLFQAACLACLGAFIVLMVTLVELAAVSTSWWYVLGFLGFLLVTLYAYAQTEKDNW